MTKNKNKIHLWAPSNVITIPRFILGNIIGTEKKKNYARGEHSQPSHLHERRVVQHWQRRISTILKVSEHKTLFQFFHDGPCGKYAYNRFCWACGISFPIETSNNQSQFNTSIFRYIMYLWHFLQISFPPLLSK